MAVRAKFLCPALLACALTACGSDDDEGAAAGAAATASAPVAGNPAAGTAAAPAPPPAAGGAPAAGATPPAAGTPATPAAGTDGAAGAGAPGAGTSGAEVPMAGAAPSSGDPDAGAPDGSAPSVPEPVVCPASALGAGVSQQTVDVGGTSRDFILQTPTGYAGDTPLPLVVDLHPLFTNASFQEGNSGYAQLANREGFIVAWPDGIAGAWDIGPCCVDADDEGFIRGLVDRVRELACVDPKRIYAAGFSMGGGMSHYLGCNVADVFAAVAPAAFDLVEEMPCQPSRPISVLMFRGTADFIVPYAGGPSTPPNGYPTMITFLGAEGTFERWAELDQCTGSPTDSGPGCKTYDQCAAGVEVTLCTATGGGHATGDPERGWEMFQRQVMP